ncbi:hypothetical protein ACH427_28060 [Streptomyces sp. NPDC020379]|uniref:hypothetical protein n=1 Tax=Streptomyces sp. NPDC020379 TaxID=3365071 RepID=UPI00378C5630
MDATTSQPLDVTGLICVTPPYFALSNLRRTAPGEATATIPVEADPGGQATVIGLFEAGRHLAILGLSAAATVNPAAGRHYYLARTGDCTWLAPPAPPGTSRPVGLRGHARATFTDTRHVTAHTRLTDPDGAVLTRLTVTYDVLSERLFAHFFGRPAPTPAPTGNPYSRPCPLGEPTFHGDSVSADITVTPDLCAGHFDGYPALPVAITATTMTTLTDRLVARDDPAARWRPAAFRLEASELPWAGRTMTVTVRSAPPTGRAGRAVHCAARIDGRTVTTADIDLDVHRAPSS